MKITTLIENTCETGDYKYEHGLSLFIETDKCKILFDTGASINFTLNAKKMGINLSEVDIAVISHGHYDHGGGLASFLSINDKAPIYIRSGAFEKFYSEKSAGVTKHIGLEKNIENNARLELVEKDQNIGFDLELLTNIKGNKLLPSGNNHLSVYKNGSYIADDFSHEQSLVIKEKNKLVLIVGCAHKGIVNILESFANKYCKHPDYVFGGFHLSYEQISNTKKSIDISYQTGLFLHGLETKFYTFHCTGKESYKTLKSLMGDSIEYLSTGRQIII